MLGITQFILGDSTSRQWHPKIGRCLHSTLVLFCTLCQWSLTLFSFLATQKQLYLKFLKVLLFSLNIYVAFSTFCKALRLHQTKNRDVSWKVWKLLFKGSHSEDKCHFINWKSSKTNLLLQTKVILVSDHRGKS